MSGSRFNRIRRQALEACQAAESAQGEEFVFSINALPDDQRRAAHALLNAALAHCLLAPGKAIPKTLHWQGRRWFLSPVGRGRVQVSAYPGCCGLVSMPGALV